AQWLACDQLAQVAGSVAPPVGVNVRVEPVLERAELAAGDLLVEVADLAADRLPELRRVEIAERVRREIPDQAEAPVDVLQTAAPVVWHVDAEEFLEPLVPDRREPARLERAG